MARYGKKAQSKVEKTMRERKRGTLRSGRSGKKVTSRKQAIAIGLSEARRAGAKVPKRRSSSSSRDRSDRETPAREFAGTAGRQCSSTRAVLLRPGDVRLHPPPERSGGFVGLCRKSSTSASGGRLAPCRRTG